MKVILLCIAFTSSLLQACPTCIGRLDKNTPPFFSAEYDEHYQSYASNQENNEAAADVEEEA